MTRDRLPSGRPRFYGRRRGKPLRPGRQKLVDELLPRLQVPEPGPGDSLDPAALFPDGPRPLWLEIGFGSGEHLAERARARPDVGFIGCEPFLNGVAALLAGIRERELDNVRIFPDDARLLLPALPDACLEQVFVLFPDPWPKARHWSRRFLTPDNVAELARLLADNGTLRVASDDPGMIQWVLEKVRAAPAFEWSARHAGDWRQRPADWPPTRYEHKAVREGRPPVYMTFHRRPRGCERDTQRT